MSLTLLSIACLPAALAAVLELPVRVQDGYPMVEVIAGTPAVSHSLLFDTGSSTTWMFTSDCLLSGTTCLNHSKYNRTGYDEASSSTSEATGITGSIDYLGGVTAGDAVRDIFSLPSAPNTTWTQSFLAANESSWSNIPADGFLGLAFSTIAVANTTTVVETLLQDDLLDEPRFALYYGVELDDTNGDGTGTLTFGGSHEDVYVDGNLTWTQLAPSGQTTQLWKTNMQWMVGTSPDNTTTTGTKTTQIPLGGNWGVFDTGAGRISVPDAVVDELYASIGMNWTAILNGDVIPLCEDFTDAWSVELNIGDAYSPTKIVLTGDMLKTPGFATGEDKYCWPPFDNEGSSGLWLFGGDFLQKFYTVFDFGGSTPPEYKARIGFGELKEQYRPY
ncbi:unnamed protein product [Discula destructiva]